MTEAEGAGKGASDVPGRLLLATEETYLAAYEELAGRPEGEQYLVFRLGDQSYGLPLARLAELRRYEPPTPVPGTKDFVLGVLGVRGDVATIVDLAQRLGLPPVEPGPAARIVMLEGEDLLGLVVSSVVGVATVPAWEQEPPPPGLATAAAQFITAIGRTRDGLRIGLLDADRLAEFEALEGT